MPDAPRRRRRDQQDSQEQSEDDAPGFNVPKNAHAIQSTGVDALIVGQTCGENNWLHFGRFLALTLRPCAILALREAILYEESGEPRRTRTCNPLIKSQLLYH